MENLDLIRAERLAIADLLEGLSSDQWDTPSLCGRWTVREVAAHLMVGPTGSLAGFLHAMLRARGNFHKANDLLARSAAERPTSELVSNLRERAGSTFAPPSYDWNAPLADAMIHGQDIARPLEISLDRPVESWSKVLTFLVSKKAQGAFVPRGAPAVVWNASDTGWSVGEGPEVSGPAASLAMVLAGRPAGLTELHGDGVEQVRVWCAPG